MYMGKCVITHLGHIVGEESWQGAGKLLIHCSLLLGGATHLYHTKHTHKHILLSNDE